MRSTVRLLVVGVLVVVAIGCSKKDETATTGATSTTKASTGSTAASVTTTAKPAGSVVIPPGAVSIADYAFEPENRTVKVGEKITWTNMDDFPHYVKSDEGIELDSESMKQNGTYSHTFDKPGSYPYHCEIHNTMKGSITVT